MNTLNKLNPHTNDIIKLFNSGVSAAEIARRFDTTTTTATSFLTKLGLWTPRKRGAKHIHSEEAVELFRSGEAPFLIQKKLGISKSCFYSIAKRAGIDLRGHVGYAPSEDQLRKSAKTRQKNVTMHPNEQIVFDRLTNAGINVIPQFAFNTQILDFFLPDLNIAVEITGRGTYCKYLRNGWFVDRIKNLGESGSHIHVIAYGDDIGEESIRDLIAWVEFLRATPTPCRQYRMVRGNGEVIATGKSDCVHLPAILASVNAF